MPGKEYVKQLEDAGWPQEFREKLDVGNLESNIGIATLWTFRDVVHKDTCRSQNNPETTQEHSHLDGEQNALYLKAVFLALLEAFYCADQYIHRCVFL